MYDSFKKLLGIFHEKRDLILNGKNDIENFLYSQLNLLFNETFQIIQNYQDYTPEELREIILTFESEWHRLLFDLGPIFKDDQGFIIDITQGTEIN